MAKFVGVLQSVSWMAMALGGICESLLGGYVLINFQMENIFLFFLLFCQWYNYFHVLSIRRVLLAIKLRQKILSFDELNRSISDEEESSNQMCKTNSLMRKKSSK